MPLITAYQRLRAAMLPASKSDFPKCLYLDQNKWIDIARAHYEKPGGEPFQPCLAAIRAATKSGKLVVPFSITNAIEAMIPRDAGRRQRLAEFMVELAGNRTMSPEYVVTTSEIENATRLLFGTPAAATPRSTLVQIGIIHAIGIGHETQGVFPPELNVAFTAFMATPEKTVEFLVGAGGKRDQIQAALQGEGNAKDIFEADREAARGMSRVERQRAELYGLFSKNAEYRTGLEAGLKAVGRSRDQFKTEMNCDEKLVQFVTSIPNFDVFITLRIEREKDRAREVEHNDIRDLDWLSVAVPYSNIVVSERYWGGKITAAGLDTKYETVLLNDLKELPARLSTMGC